jgi:hypothetical protein
MRSELAAIYSPALSVDDSIDFRVESSDKSAMKLFTRSLGRLILILAGCLFILSDSATNAKSSPRRPGGSRYKRSDASPFTGIWIIPASVALILLPPIIVFVYNFVRDPATPTLMKNLSDLIYDRTFGYLSSKTKKQSKKKAAFQD